MPLRIGFDMDGVLADFDSAFHEAEARLFGSAGAGAAGEPEREEEAQELATRRRGGAPEDAAEERLVSARQTKRKRDRVWQAIQSTPNFWETLAPTDAGAVRRIHQLMLHHRWEVFFITQRPKTAGDTVQRQTQRWLVEQGFDLPSVLVLGGSRGAAAGALRLDYHVDDSPQNCLDVISDSRAKTILIVPDNDETTVASARKLGVGTARSIGEAIDILEQASTAQAQPGLLARIATMVGWKD
jgi:FMN phosphatase YigB (HAD superfamily)